LTEEITNSDVATSYHLGPIMAEEMIDDLTPTDPALGADLYDLADGNLVDVQAIWDHWVEEQAVEVGPDGHWHRTDTWQDVYGSLYDEAIALPDRAHAAL
jgi:hypothetical protein